MGGGASSRNMSREQVCVYSSDQYRIEYMVQLDMPDAHATPSRTMPVARDEQRPLQHAPFTSKGPGVAHVQSLVERNNQVLGGTGWTVPARASKRKPSDQECGLVSSSGEPVPLASVHVRVDVVDLASQVHGRLAKCSMLLCSISQFPCHR